MPKVKLDRAGDNGEANGKINHIRCDGEVVPLDSLLLDPDNARLHPERNMEAIKASLAIYGQLSPLVVRSQNRMIAAGNGRWQAAKELGWTKIAITMRPMTSVEFVGFALADNRTAELATWNAEVVNRLGMISGVSMVGWSRDELLAVRAQAQTALTDPDEVPESPAVPITRVGDLWTLGDHRLICGDSTNLEVVKKLLGKEIPFLMVTDPPYGVDYDANWRNEVDNWGRSRIGKVPNDDRTDWKSAWRLFPGDVVYCWHAPTFGPDVNKHLCSSDFLVRYQIVWVKQNQVMSRGAYHWKHEGLLYAVRNKKISKWAGGRSQTTVWEISNSNPCGGGTHDDSETFHSTQKPVECMARPIRNHGDINDSVYDPFVGSGTTIIAAQQLGRKCFAVDIDPVYCDVTLQRWADYTGQEPIREADGVTWSEAKAERPA